MLRDLSSFYLESRWTHVICIESTTAAVPSQTVRRTSIIDAPTEDPSLVINGA